MIQSITKIERDGYVIIKNPDLVNEYKIINTSLTVGSGERSIFFGEIKVNEPLKVYGELDVLQGKEIIDPPQSLDYNSFVISENTSYSQSPTFSSGGNYYFYIYPNLPQGLSLNTSTGVISGTPTETISITQFIVSLKNEGGKLTDAINITVGTPPVNLTYYPFRLYVDNDDLKELSTIASLGAGTLPVTYSISPSLSSGLSFNTSNGSISGIPSSTLTTQSYTVTASSPFGNTTQEIIIEVTDFIITSDIETNSSYTGTGVIPPNYDITIEEGVILTIEENI